MPACLELVAAPASVLVPVLGAQTDWVVRSLDRLDKRLDRIEETFLKEHGERIARLETRIAP